MATRSAARFARLAPAVCLTMIAAGSASGQVVATWNASPFGNWTDGSRWSTAPLFPHNGQPNPGDTYSAVVPGGFVTLDQNIAIEDYTQSGTGTLNNQFGVAQNTLTVNRVFRWQGGEIEGRVTVAALGGIEISGAAIKRLDAFNPVNIPQVINSATATWSGGGVNATVVSDASGVFFPRFQNLAGATFLSQANSFFNVQLDNTGTFLRNAGGGTAVHRGPFNNDGLASITSGTLELARGGVSSGTFSLGPGTRLYLFGHHLTADSTLLGSGVVFFSNPSGGGTQVGDTVIDGGYSVAGTVIDQRLQFNAVGSTGTLLINKATGEPVTGTGTLTVTGAGTYQIGNFGGDLTIRALGGIDLALTSNPRFADNARLQMAGGTSGWSGNFSLLEFRDNARLDVLAGATFEVVNAVGNRRIFSNGTTPGLFYNEGVLRKSGTGGLLVEIPAINRGLVLAGGGTTGFLAGVIIDASSGEIRVSGGGVVAGAVTLADGRLTGSGTFLGPIDSSGALAPGVGGAGSLAFSSGVVLRPEGRLEMDLGGNTPGATFDALRVADTMELAGELSLSLINGFVPTTGDAFRIIDAPAGVGITGLFDLILGREVNPTTWLATVYRPGSVTVAVALPGDANLDGSVNIADFSILASNFNRPGDWLQGNFNGDPLVGIGDFALLAANFNQSLPEGARRGAVAPEPSSAVGGVVIAAVLLRRRGHGRRTVAMDRF